MSKETHEMPQEDFRKLQLIELEMLLEVDRICRKHKIQYSLSAGSVLGAVRHKGFIPWDDDLDIQMRREAYERFTKICRIDLDMRRFFLQNSDTDPGYRWGYAKLRRIGTEYIRKGQEMLRCVSGVSIDIFPVDNVPDNILIRYVYHYIRRVCIKTLWSVIGMKTCKNMMLRFMYTILSHINKKLPLFILGWLAKQANKEKTEFEYTISFYRKDGFNNTYSVAEREGDRAVWFDSVVEMEFEGFPIFIGAGYKEYLKEKYIDIWSYPPESQRTLHPPASYFLDVDINLRGRSVRDMLLKEYIYVENPAKGTDI